MRAGSPELVKAPRLECELVPDAERRDFSYWFDGDDACVGYVDTTAFHAWVAAGAPIAPRERRMAAVASRFIEAAQREGRRASFFGTEERFTSAVQFRALAIGEQPVWDPRNWTEALLLELQPAGAASPGPSQRGDSARAAGG